MLSEIYLEKNHQSQKLTRNISDNPEQRKNAINSLYTLKKLQGILMISRTEKLHQTKRKDIYVPSPDLSQKYLLISTKNVIYYGYLSPDGFPEDPHAICIFSEGSYYEGQFRKGRPNGEGRLCNLQCSYVYEGGWKNGLPHGNGKEQIDNNYYQGQFYEGKKNGKGIQVYPDGSRFEGQFKNNVIEGEGRYTSETNIWSGNWKDGYLDGYGQQIIAKKNIQDLGGASQYRGEFKKGQKDGKGNFKWRQKYEYDGQFQKGQIHGKGIFKFKGRSYSGEWQKGTQVRMWELKSSRVSPSSGKIQEGDSKRRERK